MYMHKNVNLGTYSYIICDKTNLFDAFFFLLHICVRDIATLCSGLFIIRWGVWTDTRRVLTKNKPLFIAFLKEPRIEQNLLHLVVTSMMKGLYLTGELLKISDYYKAVIMKSYANLKILK